MDLRQLTILLAVAEHGSFSAAARSLHTVQSNVSTHVARLEQEVNAVLIDRRSMKPTAEGKAVIERAQRIRTELNSIDNDMQSMREEVRGTVRIGCIGTIARWIAIPLLDRLDTRYPSLHPVLIDSATTSLQQLLRSGDLDLAILDGPILDRDFESEPLFDEELVVLSKSNHPLAASNTVTPEALAAHELVLTPKGTTFRDALDAELAINGIKLRQKAEVEGLRLLATLAYQGYAPALVPASAASGFPPGDWAIIHIEGMSRRSVLLTRDRRITPSLPVQATHTEILNTAREIGPNQPGIHLTLPPPMTVPATTPQ